MGVPHHQPKIYKNEPFTNRNHIPVQYRALRQEGNKMLGKERGLQCRRAWTSVPTQPCLCSVTFTVNVLNSLSLAVLVCKTGSGRPTWHNCCGIAEGNTSLTSSTLLTNQPPFLTAFSHFTGETTESQRCEETRPGQDGYKLWSQQASPEHLAPESKPTRPMPLSLRTQVWVSLSLFLIPPFKKKGVG